MDLFTAKKLTALRKYYGLSQEALAEKAGVSRQAISKWERGEASPDTDNLLTLSRLYSVSIDDLLGEKSAEEIIEEKEKQKEAEATAKNPEALDTKGPATTVVNENPPYASGAVNNIPVSEAPSSGPSEQAPVYDTNGFTPEGNVPYEKGGVAPKKPSQGKKGNKEKPDPLYPGVGKNMLKFPYIIIAAIVYIIIGYTAHIWHPTWMIFLTVPAYYLTIPAFFAPTKKKFLLRLPAYYYIIVLYIFLGIFFSLWAKTWILFLFIPVYYWVVSLIKTDK